MAARMKLTMSKEKHVMCPIEEVSLHVLAEPNERFPEHTVVLAVKHGRITAFESFAEIDPEPSPRSKLLLLRERDLQKLQP